MDDNGGNQSMPSRTAMSWESLIPDSFINTAYIPSLKIMVTAGSFVRYRHCHVGRIVKIVNSIELVPNNECKQVHLIASPEGAEEIPVQYVKVNIFNDRQVMTGQFNFPTSNHDRFDTGWQRIVQTDKFLWIPSHAIAGLAFVAFENNDDDVFDDCKGMSFFYITKYRITETGDVSLIPLHECPPFPGQMEKFKRLWSLDYCELFFNTIRQIRFEMQKILCRIAQSQGDFSAKNTKMHVPSCSWYFIKNTMAAEGVDSISTVRYSQPRVFLSWGLSYHSCRSTGFLDVLRFDTAKKMEVFRRVFGKMSGYGVRKKRPRYSDGPLFLSLNDVLNVVACSSSADDQDGNDSIDNTRFQRFGVVDDGIDLLYNMSEASLQISLRYRKQVVTSEALASLADVGVCNPAIMQSASQSNSDNNAVTHVSKDMEFIEGMYVMRVDEVRDSVVYARKVYKLDSNGRTAKVNALEVLAYRDVQAVHQKIQQMLE
jgi:hypothetical protein